MRVYDRQDIQWRGHQLRLKTGKLLATLEPDRAWAGMYRVLLDGTRTDMVNLSRAKDAVVVLVLAKLNA